MRRPVLVLVAVALAATVALGGQLVAGAASEDGNQANVLDGGDSFTWSHFGDPGKGQFIQEGHVVQDVEGFLAVDTQGQGRAIKLIGNPPKRVAVKAELWEWDGVEYVLLAASALVNSGDTGKLATAQTEEIAWSDACTARYTKTVAQSRWADNSLSTLTRTGPFILNPACFFGGTAELKKLQSR